CAALWVAVTTIPAADLFPFLVSRQASNGTPNVADISSWLPQKAAGSSGFVRATPAGQLVTDAGPIRFWGTNTVFEGSFPETREKAERAAARLARLGINCVRLHHMDSQSIWEGSPNKTILSEAKMARLDYFIYQLKQHGIYVNINLHVSRDLGSKEGFAREPGPLPTFGKGINQFEPRMIELQKKYARDLLTHVNPHTKRPYTNEPAVAFIEINNENSLLNRWRYGALDNLPNSYAATFRRLWNGWLKRKYGTSEALRAAWNIGADGLGTQMLRDTTFGGQTAAGEPTWYLQPDDTIQADDQVLGNGPDGQRVRRINVRDTGRAAFLPQLIHADLSVKKGQTYTLSFRARSDQAAQLTVNCMMNHAPWGKLGFDTRIATSDAWQGHTFTFVASQDDRKARITLIMPARGVYEFADASLKPGGIAGLAPGQRLEDGSVALVKRRDFRVTSRQLHDFIDFVYETEAEYWRTMYSYTKDDLRARPIVSGTQLSASPVTLQAELDYIDSHEYWHHPEFPKGRSWDKTSAWFVRNEALVNQPTGTLGRLASRRVAGMAYTVSEYEHPEPNQFGAEGLPMLAAFAAFQDWAGVFSFAHTHDTNYEPDFMTGFFCMKASPHKLVHMPACVAMFRRGDVVPAKRMLRAPLTRSRERQLLRNLPDPTKLVTDTVGLDSRWALRHGIGLDLLKNAPEPEPLGSGESVIGAKRVVSDTGQMVWDTSRSDRGVFTISTPRTQLFTGFADGRRLNLAGLELAAIESRTGAATISAVCIDGRDLRSPGRVLIAASGTAQNTDAVLEDLGGDRVTLRKNWGKGPILCEGITATIGLPVSPDRVTAYALNGDGTRLAMVPSVPRDGKTLLKLNPTYRTLWYEVVIE
ncbi:MAG: hypothetical protein HN904_01735, partial [Victivallales bacterium]|nr:hypothetical protein [Victivallales bacterium]